MTLNQLLARGKRADEIYVATVEALARPGRWTAPAGVYLIRDEYGSVRYVGHTTRSLESRMREHIFKIGLSVQWLVFVIPFGDLALETALIRRYLPDFNVRHSIRARRRTLEWKLGTALNSREFWAYLPDLRQQRRVSLR